MKLTGRRIVWRMLRADPTWEIPQQIERGIGLQKHGVRAFNSLAQIRPYNGDTFSGLRTASSAAYSEPQRGEPYENPGEQVSPDFPSERDFNKGERLRQARHEADERKKPPADTASQHAAADTASQHADTDPFCALDPHRELQAQIISEGKADTRHFLEQSTFTMPLESSISEKAMVALIKNREEAAHTLPHPVWTAEAVESVKATHCRPEKVVDLAAFICVKGLRAMFDVCSGYALGRVDERGWLNRIVFLETVAGVPGMVGAMVRHLSSLRRMERDYGWIHTLLEEAENERMHLMTALVLKRPSYIFRAGVLMTQGLFLTAFTISYLLSKRFAHRFVGYLEEEAVITYTKLLREIDLGHLPLFERLPAPPVAKDYWSLSSDATFRDVVLAVRADESHHREVNHTFADLQVNSPNPFIWHR